MTSFLKPCPFCGSDPQTRRDYSDGELVAFCANQECSIAPVVAKLGQWVPHEPGGQSGHTDWQDAQERVEAAWNRRAHDDLITYAASELERFRELLAACYSGAKLYRDDGELQDTSARPHIDFRRDSASEIQRKMQARRAR